jgi:ribosomal protein L7/L12
MDDQRLKVFFKFDDSDLQVNRIGQFTEKQKARLVAQDKSSRKWSLIGGLGLLLIAAIGPAVALLVWLNSLDWGFKISFVIGFGILWLLFWVWGYNGIDLLNRSFSRREYKLANVRGRAKIVRIEASINHRPVIHHELHIGGQRFKVASQLADIILPGDESEYIIYFVGSLDKKANDLSVIKDYDSVLSAEAVSKAQSVPPETKSTGSLVLLNGGPKILETIKVIRQLTGLDYQDAKNLAETPRGIVLRDVDETIAGQAVLLFAKAGAEVGFE